MKRIGSIFLGLFLCSVFAYPQSPKMQKELDSLLQLLTQLPEDSTQAHVLNELAYYYIKIPDADTVLYYGRLCYELSDRISFPQGMINGLSRMASAHYYNRDYEEAIKCLQQSLALARKMNYEGDIMVNLGLLGDNYRDLGNMDQALFYQKEALQYARKLGKKGAIARVTPIIGDILRMMNRQQEAVVYLKEGIEASKEINDPKSIAYSLTEMGKFHFVEGNYTLALNYFLESLPVAEDFLKDYPDNRILIYNLYLYLGMIYNEVDEYKKSIGYFEKLYDLALDSKNNLHIAAVALHKHSQ